MTRPIAIVALLATVAIFALPAQARPNFSGKWVMDTARSEKSSFTPKASTWTVVQQGDSLILDRTSPASGTQRAVYALNGAPRSYTLRLLGTETTATSTVAWTSGSMVVHTTSRPEDAELVQNDTWTLSADGKELRVKREATYPGMNLGSPTLVFTRQP